MGFHPLTWLSGWLALVLGLQWLSAPLWLGALLAGFVSLAAVRAGKRTWALLKRARWLLLSMAVLFLFFTPGAYLPGLPQWFGVTYEGVERAYDQLSRLLIMLTTLALLHERLGTVGLLSALHALLRPFSLRDATVVRLMLVLEYAEGREKLSWREWLSPASDAMPANDTLRVPAIRLQRHDVLMILLCYTITGTWIALA